MGKEDVGLLKATGVLGIARAVSEAKERILKIKKEGVRLRIGEDVGVVGQNGE
jgi:hypothetical protein